MHKLIFWRYMKRYENPMCTHTFILYMFPMIKGLTKVLILHPLGHLMNFQTNTWNSLQFKPISNLTMVCFHQNAIRRTLRLTTPLRVKVFMSYHSPLQSRERTLASTLEISTISVRKHKEESLGERSWCLQDPLWLWSYLHRLELIQEHSDKMYVVLFSRSMFSMESILFFNICLSAAIDLESLGYICMHHTLSRAWKRSNPGFLTISAH